MSTLVTGATGLLGNNLVRMLLERGQSVRVLVRTGYDPRPLAGLDVEIVEGDVRDPEAVHRACRDIRTVIHAAAVVHIGRTRFEEQQAVNVEGTRNVARAALEAGARMVHVSTVDTLSPGTPERPTDEQTPVAGSISYPYIETKREAEQLVLEYVARGLDGLIVHPSYMLGPWDWKPSSGRMLLEVARGRALVAPPGANDFCDVRDVAWGILAAVEKGKAGRRYILGGESLPYLEAWRIFASVAGTRGPVCRAGPIMMIVGAKFGDLRTRLSGREGDVNSVSVAVSTLRRNFSSARARRELNYQPRGVREAATAAWEWFQQQGYVSGKQS